MQETHLIRHAYLPPIPLIATIHSDTDNCAQNPSLASSSKIDGIQCNEAEQLLFHTHAHLDIIIDGQYFLQNFKKNGTLCGTI